MDNKMKQKTYMSVPQFGGWEQMAPGATNYSVVFSHARQNKKQHKSDLTDIKHANLGNEREFLKSTHNKDDSVIEMQRRKKILTYFKSCIKP